MPRFEQIFANEKDHTHCWNTVRLTDHRIHLTQDRSTYYNSMERSPVTGNATIQRTGWKKGVRCGECGWKASEYRQMHGASLGRRRTETERGKN